VIRERKEQLEDSPNRSPTGSADEDPSVGECDENLLYKEWQCTAAQLPRFGKSSMGPKTGLDTLVERKISALTGNLNPSYSVILPLV
jgi:hypothetical protein